MDSRTCWFKCMFPEGTCGNVWRFYRSEQCLHAIRWKIPAHRDTVHGCKASGCKRRLRYCDNDVLWFWSILIKLEPIPRICLRSIRIFIQNRDCRWWLQKSTFHIPGVLPQNERGSETLEPAICSITRCLQRTDRFRTSVYRRKRFHVRNVQWYWCTTNTGFFCSGYRKGKRHHHTGIKRSRKSVSTVFHEKRWVRSSGLYRSYEIIWCHSWTDPDRRDRIRLCTWRKRTCSSSQQNGIW